MSDEERRELGRRAGNGDWAAYRRLGRILRREFRQARASECVCRPGDPCVLHSILSEGRPGKQETA